MTGLVAQGVPMPLKDLTPHPKNFRQHPQKQKEAVAKSIEQFGVVRNILWNRQTGHIVDGHARFEQYKEDGDTEVLVDIIDLSPEQEEELLLYLDQTTAMATLDLKLLVPMLESFQAKDNLPLAFSLPQLQTMRGDLKKLELLSKAKEEKEHSEPRVHNETRVKLGDIWEVGNHRIACGDAKDAGLLALLMEGTEGTIGCLTSPPYNAGKSEMLTNNHHTTATKYSQGGSDTLSPAELVALLIEMTENVLTFCSCAVVNMQFLAGNKVPTIEWLHRFRHHIIDKAVWTKTNPAPAMAQDVFSSACEDLWLFSPQQNATRAIPTARFRGTVSNHIALPTNSTNKHFKEHAATMSTDLAHFCLVELLTLCDVIVDPFGGTGTTALQCARLDMASRSIELVPRYCDLMLSELEAATGEEAERIGEYAVD